MNMERLIELATSSPTTQLVMPRKVAPKGDSITLHGSNEGPVGWIDAIEKNEDGGYKVIATFRSQEILDEAFAAGATSELKKAPTPEEYLSKKL